MAGESTRGECPSRPKGPTHYDVQALYSAAHPQYTRMPEDALEHISRWADSSRIGERRWPSPFLVFVRVVFEKLGILSFSVCSDKKIKNFCMLDKNSTKKIFAIMRHCDIIET